MADPKPATALDPNVWYHLTEEAVDPDYDNDFKGMLQRNQNPNSDDKDLHVWPVKRNDNPVQSFWQFVREPKSSEPIFRLPRLTFLISTRLTIRPDGL